VLPTHTEDRDKIPDSSERCHFKFEALTFKYCCQKINKCRYFVTSIVVPLKTKINLHYRVKTWRGAALMATSVVIESENRIKTENPEI